MNYFLTKIHINKIFHLQDFDIHLDTDSPKHLIITGKNGSGKTILINAIFKVFERITTQEYLDNQTEYIASLKKENDSTNKAKHFMLPATSRINF